MTNSDKSVVNNIHKNKDKEDIKSEYLKLWIELINQFEKRKNI